jgi:hypothetical protein
MSASSVATCSGSDAGEYPDAGGVEQPLSDPPGRGALVGLRAQVRHDVDDQHVAQPTTGRAAIDLYVTGATLYVDGGYGLSGVPSLQNGVT